MSPRALTLSLMLALLVSGCGSVEPVPEDRFYRLGEAVADPQGTLVQLDGVLAVGSIDSAGVHRERAILYTEPDHPTELMRYHYHAWVDGPPRLIQDHLAAFLRRADVAPLVVLDDARTDWDYLVSGRLRRFERVLASDGGSEAVVELELRLKRAGDKRPLSVGDYSTAVAVEGKSVRQAAEAFSKALETVYRRFLADLASQGR
jgi:ABC-type uncharacterized transport system auxiliary subunit